MVKMVNCMLCVFYPNEKKYAVTFLPEKKGPFCSLLSTILHSETLVQAFAQLTSFVYLEPVQFLPTPHCQRSYQWIIAGDWTHALDTFLLFSGFLSSPLFPYPIWTGPSTLLKLHIPDLPTFLHLQSWLAIAIAITSHRDGCDGFGIGISV